MDEISCERNPAPLKIYLSNSQQCEPKIKTTVKQIRISQQQISLIGYSWEDKLEKNLKKMVLISSNLTMLISEKKLVVLLDIES